MWVLENKSDTVGFRVPAAGLDPCRSQIPQFELLAGCSANAFRPDFHKVVRAIKVNADPSENQEKHHYSEHTECSAPEDPDQIKCEKT